jgi:hypothetical protein
MIVNIISEDILLDVFLTLLYTVLLLPVCERISFGC